MIWSVAIQRNEMNTHVSGKDDEATKIAIFYPPIGICAGFINASVKFNLNQALKRVKSPCVSMYTN